MYTVVSFILSNCNKNVKTASVSAEKDSAGCICLLVFSFPNCNKNVKIASVSAETDSAGCICLLVLSYSTVTSMLRLPVFQLKQTRLDVYVCQFYLIQLLLVC